MSLLIQFAPFRIFIHLVANLLKVAFYVVVDSLCDFTWDVWLGKYTVRTKRVEFGSSSMLIILARVINSGRPFFVTNGDAGCPGMYVSFACLFLISPSDKVSMIFLR